KMRGWITELRHDGDTVYLIAETASGPCLAYTVTFHGSAKPEVEDVRGQSLPPKVALRYKARDTASAALEGKFFDANYNFEVIDYLSFAAAPSREIITRPFSREASTGDHALAMLSSHTF